jgi:hypothetical protein
MTTAVSGKRFNALLEAGHVTVPRKKVAALFQLSAENLY